VAPVQAADERRERREKQRSARIRDENDFIFLYSLRARGQYGDMRTASFQIIKEAARYLQETVLTK
jgi:hypothetical protein